MSTPEDYDSLKRNGEKATGTMSAFRNGTQILYTETITYLRGDKAYTFFGERDGSLVLLRFLEELEPDKEHTVVYPADLITPWEARDKNLILPIKKGEMNLTFFDSGKRSFKGKFDIDLEGGFGKLTGEFHIPKQKQHH
jgi:hypothetical protein